MIGFLSGRSASAQVTATQPSVAELIRAADDYASRAFQDPWDMNQRTDLGWFTYGIDNPPAYLSGISVSGGVFSATSTTSDPNFWLLDTGNPFAFNTGKTGLRFPIDSSKYRRLVMRMSLAGAGISTANPGAAQILWSNHTIYPVNVPPGGVNTSNAVTTWPGWWIYSFDMQTLGVAAGVPWTSANVDSLRVDPLQVPGINISLDWVRLVEDVPANYRTIQWTGSGAVDIFLDNDTNPANGLLAQIARSATGNSFSFYVGGLPQGAYHVAISPAGAAGPYSYAQGSWQIQDIPLLSFTSPSPEGSSDDFATTQLGNPWDMDAMSDIDSFMNVNGLQIANIAAQNEQGDSLGNIRVLQGTSIAAPAPGSDDPYVHPLHFLKRGASVSIDTNRYRILTLEMGVQGDRDINRGSIARVVWKNKGGGENVSDDIILNHLSSANVIQKINLDMKTLVIDPLSSPSRVGWTGLVDSFRVDPHEFPEARTFWIKSVKLTSLERADTAYTIRWSYASQGATGVSLALYYDTTGTGFGGTQIASGLNPSNGTYAWNVSAVPNGTYYIYGVFSIGGTVVNQAYAQWPLVIDHVVQPLSTITLGRSALTFGATAAGAIATAPQEIAVTVTGSGAVTWSATTNRPWLVVSPSSGSGTGRFTVSVQSTTLPAPAALDGLVTVIASGAVNSPQTVSVVLRTMTTGTTASPFGSFDTPTDNPFGIGGNLSVAGSIAVTGWALDDVGVKQVTIWRDPVGPEPTHPNGYVYIGDATFVPGARPDVEAKFPTFPRVYRAGWGYLLLTNTLPQSNGTFKLHAVAVDEEGHQSDLGSKTIVVDNLHSVKPFGAIDAPGPGETISGTILNSGWALTPRPAAIAASGATIWVNIDGIDVGHPSFGAQRSDISSIFPGYANSNSSAGNYFLNSNEFSNSMHTISWNVYDNQGHGDGIGSRYFHIQNGALAAGADVPPELRQVLPEARSLQMRTARVKRTAPSATNYPAFRQSFDPGAKLIPVRQAGEGILEPIELKELGRLELHLPGGQSWSAAFRVGDESRALPIGSTFDAEGGIFYWQLGPAFLGDFSLEFHSSDGTILPVLVRVGAGTGPTAIQ